MFESVFKFANFVAQLVYDLANWLCNPKARIEACLTQSPEVGIFTLFGRVRKTIRD